MHSSSQKDPNLMGFSAVGISVSTWMGDMRELMGYD